MNAGQAAMGAGIMVMDDAELTTRFWSGLLNAGVYVNMAIPPATPNGYCLLRCSIGASHTSEQITTVIAAFEKVASDLAFDFSETRRAS